ncbi:UDP-2,4-diacetamido-2,4,6-trideoxy-beta-L-altropyranose hydrolase [Sporosarcina limicola]|uniref:UDP-2,4-diacetamido-2,4, 6-trideoxy-beta-L-altropyranose hydrolase n=1 Tax=Sporosarcina limicola TaxID=34101 RepID=A0A927MI10_9BACL|nr:UDP-2,4-diacetamido-2,4,6-trideoxy-beta-L-altropyranose hydrolase [Sporosarcina limicola]MBE1555020.1 UDP-2,4-diacetamido-2,4,6-trideoxy-beta-L-altropyranose hydrolase [Sporosarcina limicola]
MNIVIRTDASIKIGTGHVMRCLTLAKQLERHSGRVTFVCRNLEGNNISYLRDQGMTVHTLPPVKTSEYDVQWTKEHWELDAEETVAMMKEMNNEIDLIIVDHYGLDSQWEKKLRSYTKNMMVIDDLADRPHVCDLLLDQNYYLNMSERYKGIVPDHCIQMIGPDYVLLRDEFLQAANEPRERTGEINNILVFFGGTDPTGETIKTLEAIKELTIPEITVHVVVGASNPKRHNIEQMCSKMQNVNLYCQITTIAELMMKADLAIGAGGATTWERCFLGLPSLTVVVAENQRELTLTLANQGATTYLGYSSELTKDVIQKAILELMRNSDQLKDMTEKCADIVDSQMIKKNPVTLNIMELLQ